MGVPPPASRGIDPTTDSPGDAVSRRLSREVSISFQVVASYGGTRRYMIVTLPRIMKACSFYYLGRSRVEWFFLDIVLVSFNSDVAFA
jgi:hypothetical protein